MGRKRSSERRIATSIALEVGALVLTASLAIGERSVAEQPAIAGASGSLPSLSSDSVRLQGLTPGEIVREIDDPRTGDRWLLVRDGDHPGGPGKLLLVAGSESGEISGDRPNQSLPDGAPNSPAVPAPPRPAIRAGDRLSVEERTAVVDATLEAVALGPALPGASFELRLKIGGKVVRGVALGPGRARLTAENGARR